MQPIVQLHRGRFHSGVLTASGNPLVKTKYVCDLHRTSLPKRRLLTGEGGVKVKPDKLSAAIHEIILRYNRRYISHLSFTAQNARRKRYLSITRKS